MNCGGETNYHRNKNEQTSGCLLKNEHIIRKSLNSDNHNRFFVLLQNRNG
jgi:hypothetical protein